MSSIAVQVQRALVRRGFDIGRSGVDGIIGRDTEKAIVAFKRSIGLRPRPYLGPITLKALLEFAPDTPVVVPTGEPRWLLRARRYSGLKEIKGKQHAPEILEFWDSIGMGGINDDETAWCAAFVGHCLEAEGITSTKSAAARSYEKWGVKLDKPVVGCVATKKRGNSSWQGHVFFVVGLDARGNILGLGGNQSDAVNIQAFNPEEITGYFWPEGETLPDGTLPKTNTTVALSTRED